MFRFVVIGAIILYWHFCMDQMNLYNTKQWSRASSQFIRIEIEITNMVHFGRFLLIIPWCCRIDSSDPSISSYITSSSAKPNSVVECVHIMVLTKFIIWETGNIRGQIQNHVVASIMQHGYFSSAFVVRHQPCNLLRIP